MKKVAIAVDSNSGLTMDCAKEMGVFMLPMPFSINNVEYKEGVDLNHEQFYKFLEEDADVTTSQPPVGDVMDLWDEILQEYDELVYIPMSSALSSSTQTAEALSREEDYEGRVFVVDNHRISITQRASAVEALQMAEAGWSGARIKEFLEATAADSSIYIMVDTLKYLKKGGRVTAAGAALATVLNLKPVLTVQGEKLDAFAKVRGVKQAKVTMIKAIKDDIENRFGGMGDGWQDRIRVDVAHSSSDADVELWVNDLKAAFPGADMFVDPLSMSVGCHIGFGSLAVAVSVKHKV